ncbi:MAG: NfeD family protein, partial [Hyphomicrobiaceae bacterium]|nr:NfeD family protein [Hyphomicrobiaceae bacterium]
WQWQLILFGGIALASVFAVRQFFASYSSHSDQPDLNVRGKYYVGRIVTVEEPIVNGRGRVRVGDSLWSAQGPDMAAGARAKVVGINGTVLVIEEL